MKDLERRDVTIELNGWLFVHQKYMGSRRTMYFYVKNMVTIGSDALNVVYAINNEGKLSEKTG